MLSMTESYYKDLSWSPVYCQSEPVEVLLKGDKLTAKILYFAFLN